MQFGETSDVAGCVYFFKGKVH